jgi:disulfide bond formation protein DsbB
MAYHTLFTWIAASLTGLYHAGVQYHIFPLPSFCAVQNAETLSEFLSMPKISCDQRTLELFSIPASLYLGVFSIILSFLCIHVLRQRSV